MPTPKRPPSRTFPMAIVLVPSICQIEERKSVRYGSHSDLRTRPIVKEPANGKSSYGLDPDNLKISAGQVVLHGQPARWRKAVGPAAAKLNPWSLSACAVVNRLPLLDHRKMLSSVRMGVAALERWYWHSPFSPRKVCPDGCSRQKRIVSKTCRGLISGGAASRQSFHSGCDSLCRTVTWRSPRSARRDSVSGREIIKRK